MSAPDSSIPESANVLRSLLENLRGYLRFLNGDVAYARYLAHWQTAHAVEGKPLSRTEFFRHETERRWNGVRRCC